MRLISPLALQAGATKGGVIWHQGGLASPTSRAVVLRLVGGAALVGVGVVHLQQYFGAGFDSIPTIGTLFLLNGFGSAICAAALMVLGGWLFAAGAILIAASALGFVIVSFATPVFSVMETLRGPVVLAIIFEVVTIASLAAYLLTTRWSDGH